jgi:hypothetical protein
VSIHRRRCSRSFETVSGVMGTKCACGIAKRGACTIILDDIRIVLWRSARDMLCINGLRFLRIYRVLRSWFQQL